jgi:hypothetical protein
LSRRFAAALSVAVVLAGGAALAQSDLIVDPWKRVLSGKAPTPLVPRALEGSKGEPTDVGGRDEGTRAAAEPKPGRERSAPLAADLVVEPWPPRLVPVAAPLLPGAAAVVEAPPALHPTNWARVVPEIVDPWGPGRIAVYRDPLIVDPWAH